MRKSSFTREEFELIHGRIRSAAQSEGIHTRELFKQLGGIKKERAMSVIEFLQSEKKIEVDKKGWVHWVEGS
jgi:hypothetical protein